MLAIDNLYYDRVRTRTCCSPRSLLIINVHHEEDKNSSNTSSKIKRRNAYRTQTMKI